MRNPLFRGKICLSKKDLLEAYGGQTGIWKVYSSPSRDELGSTRELGYFEGLFEDVLKHAMTLHGYDDCSMLGEIVKIEPTKV